MLVRLRSVWDGETKVDRTMASTTQVSPFQKSASILRKPTGFMKRPCWENSGTQPTAADEFSSTAGAVLAPLSRAFQHPSFYYVNYLVYFSAKNYLVTHRSGIITVFVCFRPRFPPPLPLPFFVLGSTSMQHRTFHSFLHS